MIINKKKWIKRKRIETVGPQTASTTFPTELSLIEEEAFQYGMGMCWSQQPKELDIKVEAEILSRRIKETETMTADQEDDVKTKIESVFRLLLKKKVSELLKAFEKLCREENLNITRLDKGKGIVMKDKSKNTSNINSVLNDLIKIKEMRTEANTILKNEEQINKKLSQLKKGKISEDIYKVRSTVCQPSLQNDNQKCANDKNPPLRPIFSVIVMF